MDPTEGQSVICRFNSNKPNVQIKYYLMNVNFQGALIFRLFVIQGCLQNARQARFERSYVWKRGGRVGVKHAASSATDASGKDTRWVGSRSPLPCHSQPKQPIQSVVGVSWRNVLYQHKINANVFGRNHIIKSGIFILYLLPRPCFATGTKVVG